MILVVDRGRIVERESHAALLAAGGRYARLHREQFATEEQGGLAGSDLGDSGSAMPLLSRSAIG